MKIVIVQGNIVHQECDAVVNAANTSLLGGGGVDGAIHRAAGPELVFECRMLNGCKVGDAKITGGYRLPAKHIIHTVGPVWRGGSEGEDQLLASCYRRCYQIAKDYGLETMAFPAISTGIYRFPLERATGIARTETEAILPDPGSLREIRFVCFDSSTFDTYCTVFADLVDVTS